MPDHESPITNHDPASVVPGAVRRVPDWAWLLAVSAFAHAAALAAFCMVGTDSLYHLRMAAQIGRGEVVAAWDNPVQYHPGFATGIAGAHAVGAAAGLTLEQSALALNALAGTLLVLPVWWLARLAFGDRAARLAGLFAALHAPLVSLSADVMTEPVFLLLQSTAAAALARGLAGRSWSPWALAGAASAGALWVRAEGIYTAAVIGAAGAFAAGRAFLRRGTASASPEAAPHPATPSAGGWIFRAALALSVAVVLYSPYVRWIHDVSGRWFFTRKTSVTVAERVVVGEPDVEVHRRPISIGRSAEALGRSTGWAALPWMIAGLVVGVRRRAWSASAVVPIALAVIGCAAPFAAHLLIRYPHSPRYYLQGTLFLLPVAGLGLAAVAEALERGRGAVLAAVAVVAAAAATAGAVRDPVRCSRIGLRQAGEWVRATRGPGGWMMATKEQSLHYAEAAIVHVPASYAEVERQMTQVPGRLLVLLESDLEEMEPGFRERLLAGPLERVAVFPPDPAGHDPAWVFISK